MAHEQEQFLNVVDRDTAEARWRAALPAIRPMSEEVPLAEALGRVLAADVASPVDVPAFDRSNVDGFAVIAADTFGAGEETTRRLVLNPEEVATGVRPGLAVAAGTATPIATGAMLPRGADAVVMVEHSRLEGVGLSVTRPVAPGANVSFAGTDIARGELVLRAGALLTSRETGVLAAIGMGRVPVRVRPRVAILSTGDELAAPGQPLGPAGIHDSNATILADAVREQGGIPLPLGIVPDDAAALEQALERAVGLADLVLLSGGTSKGAGDLSYRVLERRRPGVIVHGVALKPGKPVCLGAVGPTPVVILPGFPTSAIFTFHEFVAPWLREWAGLRRQAREAWPATLPIRVNSERGRTEYVLVSLVAGQEGWAAYPMGKGSGSVTAFSRADGFVVIPAAQEYVECGERVSVTPLARDLAPADLVAIGSHCTGLDHLLGCLEAAGHTTKTIWMGSQGGLAAAAREECDVAGVHLLDPASGVYNAPFVPEGCRLVGGYGRLQGVVIRRGDARFAGVEAREAVARALEEPGCVMVNRNRGSGTRVLIDGLLGPARPAGHSVESRSHNAVAAAVAQGRADWGVAIEPVARLYGLGFLPLTAERYDFVIPEARVQRPAVARFLELLVDPGVRAALGRLGFGV